jgi:hypothetical protein
MSNTDVDRLRREADRRAEVFSRSLSATARRVRPAKLMDDAVHALDPELRALRRLEAAVQRHPVVVLAAVMGFSWFLTRTLSSSDRRRLHNDIRQEADLNAGPLHNPEGDLTHGNEHDARQRYGNEELSLEQDEESRWREQAGRQ